jgi:hypothetical protein
MLPAIPKAATANQCSTAGDTVSQHHAAGNNANLCHAHKQQQRHSLCLERQIPKQNWPQQYNQITARQQHALRQPASNL